MAGTEGRLEVTSLLVRSHMDYRPAACAPEGHPDLHVFFPRAYDPADYEHRPVSAEIKELFEYISR